MNRQEKVRIMSDMNVYDIQKELEDIICIPLELDEVVKLINYFEKRIRKETTGRSADK